MGTAASTTATRVWRPVLAPVHSGAAQSMLTVATYNILADKYATSGMHSYCPPEALAWQRRKQAILQEVLGLNADILCLQEVERPFFESELQPLMARHGYEALYYPRKKRAVSSVPGPEEGISLLFKAERFERRDSKAVRFGDCVDPALQCRFWAAVRQCEDGALLALLRDRPSGRHVLAGCTHLFWDPRYPDIKAAQAQLLCRTAARFLRAQPALQNVPEGQLAAAVPTIIAGDFNSLPFKRQSNPFDEVPPGDTLVSGVYTLLSRPSSSPAEGGIDSTHPDHPANRSFGGAGGGRQDLTQLRLTSFPLRLSSAAVLVWGREPPVTTRTASFSGALDYVWVSMGHWVVAEALAPPYPFDPAPSGQPSRINDPLDVPPSHLPPIPDKHYPSDHLPLAFRLRLLPAGSADSGG